VNMSRIFVSGRYGGYPWRYYPNNNYYYPYSYNYYPYYYSNLVRVPQTVYVYLNGAIYIYDPSTYPYYFAVQAYPVQPTNNYSYVQVLPSDQAAQIQLSDWLARGNTNVTNVNGSLVYLYCQGGGKPTKVLSGAAGTIQAPVLQVGNEFYQCQ